MSLMKKDYTLPTKWEDDSAKGAIRVTPTGQPSVIDMIRVLGGKKSPRDTWREMGKAFPEVVGKTDGFVFPGRGQQLTPVARTKEDAYYILGKLPGAVGRTYNEQAARLFVQALEDPAGLIERLRPRLTQEEEEWFEVRFRGKRTRIKFTEALKSAGASQKAYAGCTNAIYLPLFGHSASGLKKIIRLKKSIRSKTIKVRDHFTVEQLDELEQAEGISCGQLSRLHGRGLLRGAPRSRERDGHVELVCQASAEYSKKLREGTVAIPGLE